MSYIVYMYRALQHAHGSNCWCDLAWISGGCFTNSLLLAPGNLTFFPVPQKQPQIRSVNSSYEATSTLWYTRPIPQTKIQQTIPTSLFKRYIVTPFSGVRHIWRKQIVQSGKLNHEDGIINNKIITSPSVMCLRSIIRGLTPNTVLLNLCWH